MSIKNIDKEYRKIVENNLGDFQIEVLTEKYQNQVMTLGFRTLTEEVDEINRESELKHLADVFKTNIYEKYINDTNKLWVLTNENKVYGYISVRIVKDGACLTGFYIVPILRGLKFAEKLLNQTYEFARSKGCTKIIAETAYYSCRSIGFYNKYFQLDKVYYENTLKILVYTKELQFLKIKNCGR